MRNIPVFTTENGVATLVLKEIPYSAAAYILIRSTQAPEEFLQECVSFCKAVGAEKIYATGEPGLEQFPYHTTICRMTRTRANMEDTDAALFPVTQQTLEQWREIYNKGMADVPNAAYMTTADGKEMLSRGDGYFIHKEEVLLGIGIASGDRIDAVVSVRPGGGKECMLALSHALSTEQITLQVASTNERAVRLYERMGFIKTAEVSKWYKIF